MHVILTIVGGFLLLFFFLLMGRLGGNMPQGIPLAARLFIPVWALIALINLYIGVFRAGYPLHEELPILFVIIAIPAGAALLLLWRLAR